jgi:hypothetical protein
MKSNNVVFSDSGKNNDIAEVETQKAERLIKEQ